MAGPVFRIQPEVQEYPAIQQTFENLTQILTESFFIIQFDSFLTTADFPAVWTERPLFWNTGIVTFELKTAENDLDFDFGLYGWTCGDLAPVQLAQVAENLPADNTLKCLEETSPQVDLSPYDIIGIQIENTSHPSRTEFRILSLTLSFNPSFTGQHN